MKVATAPEYGGYLNRTGGSAHLSGGVWWVRHAPCYFKPLVESRPFRKGAARPSVLKCGLAYSHQVEAGREAGRFVDFMILPGERLKEFGLDGLRPDKRNQVRKGLRCCEVRQLEDLDRYIEDLRRINISQAERLAAGGNHGRPVSYYQGDARAWRTSMSRIFGAPGHEWWGAWVEGRLAAYAVTIAIEEVLIVSAAKSDSLYHQANPNDAIYFTVLSTAAAYGGFSTVVNGGPLRPSLDRFKQGFGFSCVARPYYVHDFGVAKLSRYGRDKLREFRRGSPDPTEAPRARERESRRHESPGDAG